MLSYSFLLVLAAAAPSLVNSEVLSLTSDNYHEMTAGKSVFIKFFAPWCGHCKSMAPAWEELADEWKDHKVGLVAEVDCTEEDELCEEYGVQGFPTLMYGDPMSPEAYQGARSYEALSEFAKDHISTPVCSVHNLNECEDSVKDVIATLQKKSRDELQAMDDEAQEQLEKEQEEFDAAVERINDEYEELVNKFNEKVDDIRETSNHKWIQQLLQVHENLEEPEL